MRKASVRKASAASGDVSAKVIHGLRLELQELGLYPYAARLLLALLRAGSGSSAELAELAGVPRTSVYRVMEAFTEQGLAQAVPSVGPTVWTCPGWQAVLDILDAAEEDRVRQRHERIERFRQELARVLPAKMTA